MMGELRGALMEAKEHTQDNVNRNADMRDRLNTQKAAIQSQLGDAMSNMMGVMGQSAEDLMTEEQIEKLLVATFNKFDADRSGRLEYGEFKDAFQDLGLSGNERELREAFKKVDADGSGYVDRIEFALAMKDSRMSELSLNVLMKQMNGNCFFDIIFFFKQNLKTEKHYSYEKQKRESDTSFNC